MEKAHVDFRDEIARNKRKSFFLISLIILFFIVLGYVISLVFDPSYFFVIMITSIIISVFYTWMSYYYSDRIALASVHARLASRQEFPQFYRSVESLIIAASLPIPRLYVMNSEQINAFASGRDPKNAVVCVTTGALKKLDKYELEGVLAHELSHVANYDIRFMTLTAVMVGLVAIASELFLRSLYFKSSDKNKGGVIIMILGILLAIIAPLAVQLVQLAISRKREYLADSSAVKFTRYPQGLIGALKKIKGESIVEKKVSKAVAPLFFSNPFKNSFSTHPPLERRIELLQRM